MSLTLLSPPVGEPVTLDEAKAHLRVDASDDDTLIIACFVAATRAVEARGGIALLTQGWRLTLDQAPDETLSLPIDPVQAIDAVSVINSNGDGEIVDPSLYEFAPGAPGRLRRAAPWPQPASKLDGVTIDFTAGFGAAADVPAPLKQAVLILTAHFYEQREAASDDRLYTVPQTVDALIAPYREVRL